MKNILLLGTLFLMTMSCGDDDSNNGNVNPNNPPIINPNDTITNPDIIVETVPVTDITDRTAKSGGLIIDDGGKLITEKGVCWSVNPNPIVIDSTSNEGEGADAYVSNLTGLEPNTLYYYRSYARNDDGVGYGNQLIFNTLPSLKLKIFEANISGLVVTSISESNYELEEFSSPTRKVFRTFLFDGTGGFDTIVFGIIIPDFTSSDYTLQSPTNADEPTIAFVPIENGSDIPYYSESGEISVDTDGVNYTINFNGILKKLSGSGNDSIVVSNGRIIYN